MKHLRDLKCPHKLAPDLPAYRCALRKPLGLTEGQTWVEGHVFQNRLTAQSYYNGEKEGKSSQILMTLIIDDFGGAALVYK